MKTTRRAFLATGSAFAATLGAPATLAQEGYPAKPVRFVVPFAPGGPADAVSRLVAGRLQEQLGQPFVVENIPGTGGGIGVARLARMPADGHALGFAHTATFGMGPHLSKNAGYDPERDFTPIARFAEYVNLLMVRADSPYRALGDLLAAARAKPGSLNYGSAGKGSSNHLAGELLAMHARVGLSHVPYRGTALALTDLIGGSLQFLFDAPNTALPMVAAGKLRVLATTGRTRHRLLPEVPAIAETLPGYAFVGWMGVVAPAGLAAPLQRRLAAEIEKGLAGPELGEKFTTLGLDVRYGGPEQLAEAIRRDLALWGPVIKAAGLHVE